MPQPKTYEQMKKHRFNIFPEAKAEDYSRLRDDIIENGFDESQPVTIYEGEILDGWNRQKACNEIGIKPTYTTFRGTHGEAIAFVMRTNKRRNLNSGQWATVAADAEDLMQVIAEATDEERRSMQSASLRETNAQKAMLAVGKMDSVCDKNLSQTINRNEHKNSTPTKAAELFNTNRTYVNQAVKMKQTAPEVFERVKAGTMTMQDGMKAVRAIPTDPWADDETERKAAVESGRAVIANQQRDKNLIAWAEKNGKAARIDRGSVFGNPFVLDQDGNRDEVCDAYKEHYLPNKPSIMKALPSLAGKVLICHCYPQRCHGESLIDLIDSK
jgi:hypothetical protein